MTRIQQTKIKLNKLIQRKENKMKKIRLVMIILIASIALVSCGQSVKTETNQDSTMVKQDSLKVDSLKVIDTAK